MQLSIRIDADKFQSGLDHAAEQHSAAVKVAANMVASMMLEEVSADIKSAGSFGDKYLQGLSVKVDGTKITTKLNSPGAAIFEKGGTIKGNPLLWLPISGTDAEGVRARDYGSKLFSVNRNAGGPPLLFSIKDRAPKYFGIPSVVIPKKFHIHEIAKRVMERLPQIYAEALGGLSHGGN